MSNLESSTSKQRASRHRRKQRRKRSPLLFLLFLLIGLLCLGCALYQLRPLPPQPTPVPTPTAEPTPTPTPTPTPKVIPEEDAWKLRLINYDHLLPEDFTVPELTELSNGQKVDSRIYPDLQEMMDAGRAAGFDPMVCSGFRTWAKQEYLFQRRIQRYVDQGYTWEEAEEMAPMWVARPGTSEHQAGLAVDIVSAAYQVLDETQEDTATQQWLLEHCWEYGFILRYPTDKSELTKVGYEPWHYRYVGREAALEMRDSGLCLEEYLEQFES